MSDQFKQAIEEELRKRADADPLFAKNLDKPEKNIDGCLAYILNTVKESGRQGFTDDEVFGMAAHYYDEDDIVNNPAPACKVVVNRPVELSEEEKEKLREQARQEVIEAEKQRLIKRKAKAEAKPKPQQASLF